MGKPHKSMDCISFNGKIMPADEPVILAANRGYRYADGLFETMKVMNGKILRANFHFERLFQGLSLLRFEIPLLLTADKLQQEILHLCKRNECEQLARVRLSVSRGNGGLYDGDNKLLYLIECMPLSPTVNDLNENGLVIDVYAEMKKSCDAFSNLKSANSLCYVMAALYAREQKLNDCLVLNTAGNIADSTIANVFIIKDERLFTPALSEGCVNGTMRRAILTLEAEETVLSIQDIETADEVFLTNAINGIRWVKQFREKKFNNAVTTRIYEKLLEQLYV